MAGCRISMSIVMTLAFVSSAWSQTTLPSVIQTGPANQSVTPVDTKTPITKVYSLSELGDDPNLCKWIADTIPQMIEPGSWNATEGKKNLSVYAPGKVMVINHTPAVHAQVDEFLQGMRKSMAQRTRHDPQVVPAQFAPDNARPVAPVTASQAYPVPNLSQAPKHLFHFIIRYEGEGIIDSNVTKFAEVLSKAQANENRSNWNAPPSPSDSLVAPTLGTTPAGTLPSTMYLNNVPTTVLPAGAPKMPPADPVPAAVPMPANIAPAPAAPAAPAVVGPISAR
jgi:hypothetical protein